MGRYVLDEGDVVTHTASLIAVTCCTCHVVYGLAKEHRAWLLNNPGESTYCPNGHGWHFTGKSDAQRLKEERDRNARLVGQIDQERAATEHERARVRGYQGQLAKTKKRIGKGVCPCCNRSFPDLGRHMESKHPDYGGPS